MIWDAVTALFSHPFIILLWVLVIGATVAAWWHERNL